MKKDILILAALIAVVIAVPFLATKAEEAIQIKMRNLRKNRIGNAMKKRKNAWMQANMMRR